ncbi:MAG: hypothetical protein AB7K71_12500 [Polyangiaceae bacterium]
MRLVDLSLLYLAAGIACAVALYRRAERKDRAALINALTAIPLWPLWAPIAWTAKKEPPHYDLQAYEVVTRIRVALEEGVESVTGSPLERLLNSQSAQSILDEVNRVAARHQELVELLRRDAFDLGSAERKLEQLERQGAPSRLRASARLHLENVRRLYQLAERDARALEELAELVSALRTQLVLVRLSGSSAEGVGDIVTELWARIEGLSEASEDYTPNPPPVDDADLSHGEAPAT